LSRGTTIGGLDPTTKDRFDILKLKHRIKTKNPCNANDFMVFLLDLYEKEGE
jgi:hypothetical protein